MSGTLRKLPRFADLGGGESGLAKSVTQTQCDDLRGTPGKKARACLGQLQLGHPPAALSTCQGTLSVKRPVSFPKVTSLLVLGQLWWLPGPVCSVVPRWFLPCPWCVRACSIYLVTRQLAAFTCCAMTLPLVCTPSRVIVSRLRFLFPSFAGFARILMPSLPLSLSLVAQLHSAGSSARIWHQGVP